MSKVHSGEYIRPKKACEMMGICHATFWRWVKERDDFPRPIHLSARCTVFNAADIRAWMDSHTQTRGHTPIEQPGMTPAQRSAALMETIVALVNFRKATASAHDLGAFAAPMIDRLISMDLRTAATSPEDGPKDSP